MPNSSRPWKSIGAVLFLVALVLSMPTRGLELLDRVAAVVDDDVIMESELATRMEMITRNMQAQGVTPPPATQFRSEVLNQMIVENLQLQMAKRAGVRINDQQLNNAMANVAANMGMSLDQFRADLEARGEYQATREQIRQEMILRQVQGGNLSGRIQITDEEIDNYLETSEGQQLTAPAFRVAHLLYPLPEESRDDAAVAKAEALLGDAARDIRRDGNLLSWLEEYNKGHQPQLQGGDLGWRRADELPSIFADLVPTLAAGEVSAPVRSPAGIHLVQLLDKSGGARLVIQTHARHILVKPSEIRSEEQCLDLLLKLREDIIAGADFAEVARQHTEDIASAQEGGDLGWANPGQFVPAFEKAMQDLQPGEISAPVRSDFGWHIIEVLERRERDISKDLLRERAYSRLYERKFREELDSWLQKIRDEAYVDIKA